MVALCYFLANLGPYHMHRVRKTPKPQEDQKEPGFSVLQSPVKLQDFFEDPAPAVKVADWMSPVMVSDDLLVQAYTVGETAHVGVFDWRKRKLVANLDFSDEPFFLDDSDRKAPMKILRLPNSHHFAIVYRTDYNYAALKTWDMRTLQCVRKETLVEWCDLDALIAQQPENIVYQYRYDLVLKSCTSSQIKPFYSMVMDRIENLHDMGKNNLIAALIRNKISILQTESKKANKELSCEFSHNNDRAKFLTSSPDGNHLCMHTGYEFWLFHLSCDDKNSSKWKLQEVGYADARIFADEAGVSGIIQDIQWYDDSHLIVTCLINEVYQVTLYKIEMLKNGIQCNKLKTLGEFNSPVVILLSQNNVRIHSLDGNIVQFSMRNNKELEQLADTLSTSGFGLMPHGIYQAIAEYGYDLLTFKPARAALPAAVSNTPTPKV